MNFNIEGIRLKFSSNFNEPLDEYYIEQIKKCKILCFGLRFNQNVDNIPNNIRQIQFSYDFNQSVDNLPTEIMIIDFSYYFNKSVDFLPSGLKCLSLGPKFNQPIDNLMLKYITLIT